MAARGLDIPQVDWIIQYDPPDDPKVSHQSYLSCFFAFEVFVLYLISINFSNTKSCLSNMPNYIFRSIFIELGEQLVVSMVKETLYYF